MKNTKTFTFDFPLNNGKTPLGSLNISGKCWQCDEGSPEGYLYEPYGFEIDKVAYTATGSTIGSDVTDLYEYLITNTKNGAENFECATVQHVAGIYAMETPYYVSAIIEKPKAA